MSDQDRGIPSSINIKSNSQVMIIKKHIKSRGFLCDPKINS